MSAAGPSPEERVRAMKAEELLDQFEYSLTPTWGANEVEKHRRLSGRKLYHAELLSRLSRVEELQQQVAELTEQHEALKESVLHDKSREELIADIAKALRLEFSPSYVEGPDAEFWIPAEPGPLGPFEDIVETCREFMLFFDKVDKMQRDALERAEAEKAKGVYTEQMRLKDEYKGLFRESERRLGVMREALRDELSPPPREAPCQAGLLERCRCRKCRHERIRAALTPEPAQSPTEETR